MHAEYRVRILWVHGDTTSRSYSSRSLAQKAMNDTIGTFSSAATHWWIEKREVGEWEKDL